MTGADVAETKEALLIVENLQAWYGKSHVLHGVNMSIAAGEIVSLLGRNGSGRSTLLKAIMGGVTTRGVVAIAKRQLVGLKPHQIAHAGIGYVPESRDIFPELTVKENLVLGLKPRGEGRWSMDDIFDLFPVLKTRANTQAGFLSGGEQQMLTICRTLIGDPDLIMVDEPTEGLAPKLVAAVGELLQRIAERGVSILLVEQKLVIALKVSSRVYVMGHGEIVYEGSPESLLNTPEIRAEWLEV